MNAVEIEEAISELADQQFDPEGFPYAFLEAFDNKPTTIKRLKSGSSNASDIEGGVLQRNHIHMAVCAEGEVSDTLAVLKSSPATNNARNKAKFVLATDGTDLEAEGLNSGETVACTYSDFPNHFGFFLPLAGITTVKQVRESSFDIRATGRLNKLYIGLTKSHRNWGFMMCFLYLRNVKGFKWNHKRVYRIYCELELNLRIKPKKRLYREKPEPLHVPTR